MSDLSRRAGGVLLNHVEVRSEDRAHVELRSRVVRAAAAERWRRPARMMMLVLAPAAVLAAVLFLVFGRPGMQKPMAFTVGGDLTPGVIGSYLIPVEHSSLPVRFTDGSRILLMPSARARVTSTTVHGAKLLLESGKVECDIAHLPGAEWAVAAGPYTVEVIGTSFDVSWDTARATLEVQMRQGAVRLRGPGAEGGIELRDRQRFVIRSGAPVSSASVPAPFESSVMAGPEPVTSGRALAGASGALEVSPSPGSSCDSGSAAPAIAEAPDAAAEEALSWSQRVARGEYARVVNEAEAIGIDSVLGSSSLADVGALADAARFEGKGAIASRALHAIRTRFPATARAASAAFVLGRTAEDAGQPAAALGWYDTYLAEAPGGALAPEAMGRRMMALRRMGNTAAAKQAAESYLQRFPHGPYSGMAREMTTP